MIIIVIGTSGGNHTNYHSTIFQRALYELDLNLAVENFKMKRHITPIKSAVEQRLKK